MNEPMQYDNSDNEDEVSLLFKDEDVSDSEEQEKKSLV